MIEGVHNFDPEKLRPAEYIHEPDPRNALTAWVDRTNGVVRPVQASDLHDAVAAFVLNPAVPEDIAQHFETVKNVYVYSWFIYRFQPVAEMQGLACLEMRCGFVWPMRSEPESSSRRDRACRS